MGPHHPTEIQPLQVKSAHCPRYLSLWNLAHSELSPCILFIASYAAVGKEQVSNAIVDKSSYMRVMW